MNFSVKKSDLNAILSSVSAISGRRGSRGEQIFVFCNAKNNEISLTSVDADGLNKIHAKCECVAKKESFVVFDVDLLLDVLGVFEDSDSISFDVVKKDSFSECNLSCEKKISSCICFENVDTEVQEYFSDSSVLNQDLYTMKMKTQDVKAMINSVLACVAENAISYKSTTGMLFRIYSNEGGSFLDLVGTDNLRLGIKKILVEDLNDFSGDFVIPKKSLLSLLKVVSQTKQEETKIMFKQSDVVFKFNDRVVSFTTIAEKYPEYKAIIPSTFEHFIDVKKETLFKIFKKISSVAKFDDCIKIHISKSSIAISYVNQAKKYSLSEEISNFSTSSEEPVSLTVTASSFLDSLEHITSETVRLCIQTSTKPFMIKNLGDSELEYLLMPVLG